VIIIATFTTLKTRDARTYVPRVVFVDPGNKARPA
jgi:aspartate 1-decarboxylase